ncbi:HAMP domain-containing sensor histidine kinase [Anaerococcus sp. Marseille-Q7828]|uniref:sensor histidine kinase n=1 Tax=Anaerococcus sp. Marseille-Q7828 TaxID=3036300 RepID=UPI0024ACB42B|nr:HAMP domain-containing sensor histidine kinase [Anaerococcus sp. Marseille-Q7828]
MKYSFLKNTAKPIIILLSTILVFCLVMKVLKVENFDNIFIFLILYFIICVFILLVSEINRQKRIRKLVYEFYDNMDFSKRDKLIDELGIDYKPLVDSVFYNQNKLLSKFQYNRSELIKYREIIEKWAHDIKTPLAASSLLIENNKSNMDSDLYQKLNISNQQIKNKLDTVLFYARSNSSKKDYTMKKVNIKEVLENTLIDFYPTIMEKELKIVNNTFDVDVISDYNTLGFIISQLISNSIKYADSEIIFATINNHGMRLRVSNDGSVPSTRDMPFIFEKSYTGKNSKGSASTGLGLYLVKSFADDLGIGVHAMITSDDKFLIELIFKDINEF